MAPASLPADRIEPAPTGPATCSSSGEIGMSNLGVFGDTVVEEFAAQDGGMPETGRE